MCSSWCYVDVQLIWCSWWGFWWGAVYVVQLMKSSWLYRQLMVWWGTTDEVLVMESTLWDAADAVHLMGRCRWGAADGKLLMGCSWCGAVDGVQSNWYYQLRVVNVLWRPLIIILGVTELKASADYVVWYQSHWLSAPASVQGLQYSRPAALMYMSSSGRSSIPITRHELETNFHAHMCLFLPWSRCNISYCGSKI